MLETPVVNSNRQTAALSDRRRDLLRMNPTLGAGNFLHHVHALSQNRHNPLVFSSVPFLTFGSTPLYSLSLDDFKKAVDRYAAWYANRKVTRADPIGVYFRDGIQCLIQYAALTALGAIPILTNGKMKPEIAAEHFRRIGAVGLISDNENIQALKEHLSSDGMKCFDTLEEVSTSDRADLPAWYPYQHDFEDPVMLTHSSGTTGVPKPVILHHGRWFQGIRHLLGLDLPQGAERYLCSIPASHNAAVAYAMHAVLNEAPVMIMSDYGGAAVAREIEDFKPATVVSFPQTFVEIADMESGRYNLSSVTLWINSGDAAHEAHIRRLVTHGYHYRGRIRVKGSQFVDGLGSSELGHSSFRIIHTPYTDSYNRCVGLPQSWADVCIFDDSDQPAPVGVVGRLGVRSPSVTPGYWNHSLLTYKSRIQGYWLTGDLVYRDESGYYFHVDRITDAIATPAGKLYSLQTEEMLLRNLPQLEDCTLFGVPQQKSGATEQVPILLAVLKKGIHLEPSTLLQLVNQLQGSLKRPKVAKVRIVEKESIPVGVTGKVLKATLREVYANQANT